MLKPGMMIGDRYEIIETVGSGGMSIVYKARCHKLNRYVAIKVLKPEFSDDRNFVSKFRVEAQSAAGLSHPNIVNVYDVGEDDGIYYIVMELVEGITLKQYILDHGRLPVEKVIDFTIQIASGLEVAHQNHTIHRDIKPQNIIVSKNGNLKVTDFGIARAATSNTVASTAMGSVHYISPEQARGGYSDEKSDIYSLGITMYEMATGRVPFEGDNNVTVALMHIQGEMIPPRQYYPDIPASLEKVIIKCTQKKPERRYLTAAVLIADLKRVASNPNGDFVVLGTNDINNAPTVMMSDEELNAIKENASQKQAEESVQPFPISNKNEKFDPSEFDQYFDEESEEDEDMEEDDSLMSEEEDEIDPKLEKIVVIGGIVAAVLIAMFVMLFIGQAAGWFKFGSKNKPTTEESSGVTMINVVGMKIDEAETALKDADVPYKIEHSNSDTIEADYVIEQSYKKGDTIPTTKKVVITVSSGKEEIEVPNVVGMDVDRAETLITDKGLKVSHAYEYSDEAEKDKVISQDPDATTKVADGSTITITISNGPENPDAEVPDLRGKTQNEASAALTNASLKLGNVSEDHSDSVDAGKVINQSTSVGTKVAKDSPVDITISKGAEPKAATYYVSVSGTIDATGYYSAGGTDAMEVVVNYVLGNTSYKLASGQINSTSQVFTIPSGATQGGLSSKDGHIQVLVAGKETVAGVSQSVNLSTGEE